MRAAVHGGGGAGGAPGGGAAAPAPPPPPSSRDASFTDFIEFEHSDGGGGDDAADSFLLPRAGEAAAVPGDRSFVRLLRDALQPGRDAESSRANHAFTLDERRRLSAFESIDYFAPNSAVYRAWLARQPHRRAWDRWLMMGLIGLATGLTGYALYAVIGALAEFKYGVTRWLLLHTNLGVAWLFNAAVSLALVAGSSALVVGAAPAAASSGVPEVMAYLNGVLLPKVFNVFTVAVKFASCALAVASGLPAGPEGPMVHIGAAVGAALSQGHSTTLGFSTRVFRRFRTPRDKRDFVTAGVAAGVATAFNAPIGGLLFAFEEVASFWKHSLGYQTFFACTCATLALNLARSAGKALFGRGALGWFDQDVAFEAGLEISAHVLSIAPAAVVGLLCGALGVAFTLLNLKVTRLRGALFAGCASGPRKWRRCVEPCALVLVYVTGTMLLPRAFPCTPTRCVAFDGQVFCGVSNATAAAAAGAPPPNTPPLTLPLYTCGAPAAAPSAGAGGAGAGEWLPGSGTITPDGGGGGDGGVVYYNELATLLLNTGDDAIKHLFSRGSHRRFSYRALLALLGWYFAGAALVAGSAVSTGLFVPMLLMGATVGRLVGLATTDVAEKYGALLLSGGRGGSGGGRGGDPWSWIDPGAFALVGAGALMSSVMRLTVSVAVIMVEISDDVHLLLPVLVGIMVAKWVGDAATHSLYHALLEVKCVPFLAHEPASRLSLDLLPVSDVMRAPVVCLELSMRVADLQAVLRATPHHGYPVVRDSSAGQVCLGLISRAHLLALLQQLADTHGGGGGGGGGGRAASAASSSGGALLSPNGGGPSNGLGLRPPAPSGGGEPTAAQQLQQPLMARQLSWSELNRKQMEPVEAARGPVEQQLASFSFAGGGDEGGLGGGGRGGGGRGGGGDGGGDGGGAALHVLPADWEDLDLAPGLLAQTVDLAPYVNSSALRVPETMSLERGYILFRTMGLRHLIVVDEHNRVKGIVTRKDLLGFQLDEAVARALRRVQSARHLGQSSWLAVQSPTAWGAGRGARHA